MPNEEQAILAEQAEKTKGGLLKKLRKPKKEKAPKEKKVGTEKKPKKEKPAKAKKAKPAKPKKKSVKPRKPAKPAKPKKPKKEHAKKTSEEPLVAEITEEERERNRFPFFLIPIILLIVLLLAAAASIYLDLFATRTMLIDALSSLDPENHSYAETLSEREEAILAQETELAQQQTDMQSLAEELAELQARLDKREEALDERERDLTEQEIAAMPIYRGELSEEKLAELKNLGKIYSTMAAESAASILPQLYSPVDMAAVIFYMDKNAAATLMELLTPELSAQITTEMLRE